MQQFEGEIWLQGPPNSNKVAKYEERRPLSDAAEEFKLAGRRGCPHFAVHVALGTVIHRFFPTIDLTLSAYYLN